MSDTSLRVLAALTGAALVGVIVVGGIVGSHAVAVDLQGRAERALVAAGLDGVEVELSGREVALVGGSSVDRHEAREIVAGIRGVRSVRVTPGDGSDVPGDSVGPSATGAPSIVLTRTSGGVQIGGTVPTADASAEIKARAAEAFGLAVSGDLTVDSSVGPADWVGTLPGLLDEVADVSNLVLDLDGDRSVEIGGSVTSRAREDEILRLVATTFPDLELTDRLVVGEG